MVTLKHLSYCILKRDLLLYTGNKTWVWSLYWEDPLEEKMATHSSILAWRIPWTGEPGGLQSMGSQSRTRRKQLSTHTQRMSRLHFFFHLVIRVLVKTQEKALNQSWVFIGRTDAEAEAPILWPPHAENWLPRKDPDASKDWRQEEKGMTEVEMVGCHHQGDGHEFE